MKTALLVLIVSLIAVATVSAQPPVAWQKVLTMSTDDDEISVVQQTGDAGYILGGWTGSWVGGGTAFLVRLDAQGDSLWSRAYGSNVLASCRDLRVLPDGGFLLVGEAPTSTGYSDASILRTDSAGTVIWNRLYGGEYSDQFNALELTPDGGCIAVGTYRQQGWSDHWYAVKADAQGDSQWTSRGEAGDPASRVAISHDGGFVVAAGPRLVKLNSSGTPLWSAWLSGSATDVIPSVGSGYMVAGIVGDEWDAVGCLWQVTESGQSFEWGRYNGSSHMTWLNAMTSRNPDWEEFMVAGFTGYSWYSARRIFIAVVSGPGAAYWTMEIRPDTLYNRANDIITTTDGGFAIAGSVERAGYHVHSYVAKVCPFSVGGGHFEVIAGGPPDWGLALHHEGWEGITRACFTDFSAGTYGEVTGSAASIWSVLPNGDGNNGDSVVFVSTEIWGDGSIDTFWLRNMDSRCVVTWGAGCRTDTVGLHNGGHAVLLAEGSREEAYRLVHDEAQVLQLVFPGVAAGTTGRVSGSAMSSWSVLPNGDGNNGDSVIFVASVPLTSGSLDTFWVSRPFDSSCTSRWAAGCRMGAVNVVNCVLDGLEFSGANYGYPHTDITIHVNTEFNVEQYEIWWLQWNGRFLRAQSFPAVNDSGPHEYVFQDRIGHTQWLLVIEDVYGCRYTFSDRILILGQNVPAADPMAPAPLVFSLSSFPNPFNPSTTLSFSLPREARARIAVFDVLGREVALLADNVFTAGEHRIVFDGSSLPSGLYFARLQSGPMQTTRKLLLMK